MDIYYKGYHFNKNNYEYKIIAEDNFHLLCQCTTNDENGKMHYIVIERREIIDYRLYTKK